MESTREKILYLGENLILQKGYKAFTYNDISSQLNIKNAAVHYYFPKKSDLVIGVFEKVQERFDTLWAYHTNNTATAKLEAFIKVYNDNADLDMVCLIGAMSAEFYLLEDTVQQALTAIVNNISDKVTQILKEGKESGEFHFEEKPRTMALKIITNLLGGLQIARISGKKSYDLIKKSIVKSLT